jgi:hypothetical protein
MTHSERRKHPRVETLNHVTFVCIDPNGNEVAEGFGKAVNISQGGILLETFEAVESEYILLMAIGFNEEIIEINGEIVYSRPASNGMFHTGIRFTESHEKQIEVIKSLIKTFCRNKARSVN